MTSAYTANKNYEKQGTGDNPNTWGTVLNNNVITIADKNLGGRNNISVAGSSNVTLSQSQADNIFHNLTGVLTGSINYIFPDKGGIYVIKNATTGSFNITVKPTTGTGVIVAQGVTRTVFIDPDQAIAQFIDPIASSLVTTNNQSGNYTLLAADFATDTSVTSTSASAQTFTIPPYSTLPTTTGALIAFRRGGTGALAIAAGSGVTINYVYGLNLTSQYSQAVAVSSAQDVWNLTGDLT